MELDVAWPRTRRGCSSKVLPKSSFCSPESEGCSPTSEGAEEEPLKCRGAALNREVQAASSHPKGSQVRAASGRGRDIFPKLDQGWSGEMDEDGSCGDAQPMPEVFFAMQ